MEAFANGQNLPAEFYSKLMQLWVFCLKCLFRFCFKISLRLAHKTPSTDNCFAFMILFFSGEGGGDGFE